MAIAKMTLIGMQEFMLAENDDIFADLVLPDELNKDTLTDNILMRSGEFPVLWANPFFVKNMIGIWARKNLDMFKKWVYALEQEYNPIYNYDRYEESTDNEKTTGSGSGTDTHSVTGYDSNALQTNDQVSTGSTASGTRDNGHKAHLYGNIGVTTATAMQKEFLELYGSWNLYDKICDLFTDEFCLKVY